MKKDFSDFLFDFLSHKLFEDGPSIVININTSKSDKSVEPQISPLNGNPSPSSVPGIPLPPSPMPANMSMQSEPDSINPAGPEPTSNLNEPPYFEDEMPPQNGDPNSEEPEPPQGENVIGDPQMATMDQLKSMGPEPGTPPPGMGEDPSQPPYFDDSAPTQGLDPNAEVPSGPEGMPPGLDPSMAGMPPIGQDPSPEDEFGADQNALEGMPSRFSEDPNAEMPPMGQDPSQAGMPPIDPSMMGGGMPPMPGMDPSQGGMPQGLDPSMMGGDPSQMGGMPPQDPSQMGMPPMGGDPSQMGGMSPMGDPSQMGMPPMGGDPSQMGGMPPAGQDPSQMGGQSGQDPNQPPMGIMPDPLIQIEEITKAQSMIDVHDKLTQLEKLLENFSNFKFEIIKRRLKEAVDMFNLVVNNIAVFQPNMENILIKFKEFIITMITEIQNAQYDLERDEDNLRR